MPQTYRVHICKRIFPQKTSISLHQTVGGLYVLQQPSFTDDFKHFGSFLLASIIKVSCVFFVLCTVGGIFMSHDWKKKLSTKFKYTDSYALIFFSFFGMNKFLWHQAAGHLKSINQNSSTVRGTKVNKYIHVLVTSQWWDLLCKFICCDHLGYLLNLHAPWCHWKKHLHV